VRVIQNAEMEEAVTKIAHRLGLSGFAGFDFMVDGSGEAYLLEMNVRPTQISHLAFDESTDLIGALAEWLLGQKRPPLFPCPSSQTIALFPQELWRDASSPHLSSAYHDVPRHLPQFVEMYSKPLAHEMPGINAVLGRMPGINRLVRRTMGL
jgi:hypothetical protein